MGLVGAAADARRQAILESAVAESRQSAHLDHLTIFVRNADRSRDWYASTLGLKVEFEVPSPRAVALQDSGGFGLFVEQRPVAECTPSCVVTFRVEDVDALAQALQGRGVTLSAAPQKMFWGYGAELRDPDGYLVRLWDEQSMKQKGG
jgi:catechol 2,3-dioxygenase-like lactoylglutathione lyase family enzyme